MKLSELSLDRNLYRDNTQSSETQDSSFVSLDSSEAEPTPIASGGSAQDINTGNVQIDGAQLTPGSIPPATLDVSNWGWGQTCAFSSTDLDTVSWGAGTFTSANGLSYSISAGDTGNMSAKTYIYLDLNVSNTVYQTTTTPATAVGVGKVLIAVAQNAAVSATFMLSEATQIVGDNVIANSINASKLTAGSVAVDVYLAVGSGNAIFKADATGIYLGNATFASAPFNVNMDGDIVASSLRRKDFHWFTLFESTTGFSPSGGSIATNGDGIVLQTTPTINTDVSIYKQVRTYSNSSEFVWSKKRSLKTTFYFVDSVDNLKATLVTGVTEYDSLNNYGIGFYIENDTVYGICADGTNHTTSSLGTIISNRAYTLSYEYTPGTSAKFYLNNDLQATITTNLPSDTDYADEPLHIVLTNTAAENKNLIVSYWDFWQEN